MKINLILALTLLTSYSVVAVEKTKGYMTLIGGGGEPEDAPTTQFDDAAKSLGSFYQANKKYYQTNVNFNGGHTQTEAMINESYKDAQIENGFSQESYDRIVKNYIDRIEKKEIKEGEKILLYIDSHGGETEGNTHQVSAAKAALRNMNSGTNGGMISLDSLAALSKAAKDNNIKLAIVDASCHSGNSLVLANENTCVISSSGPKHYGYSNFSQRFASNMASGKNLEEIFLKTREETDGAGFPEISSPAGIEVQELLYSKLTPFMYYHDEYRGMALDKIDNYFKEQANDYSARSCEREQDYTGLKKVLDLIEEMTSVEKKSVFGAKVSMKKTIDLTALKNQIEAYKKVQDDYIKRLASISMPALDTREPMEVGTDRKKNPGYTHRQLLAGDWAYYIEAKRKVLDKGSLSPEDQVETEKAKEFYEASLQAKEKILRDHPEYNQYQAILDELKTDQKVSRIEASRIEKEAQIAYNAYYKKLSQEANNSEKPKSNPCKDFIL